MLIFAGDDFDVTEDYRRLKSLFIGKYFISYLQDSSSRHSKSCHWWWQFAASLWINSFSLLISLFPFNYFVFPTRHRELKGCYTI